MTLWRDSKKKKFELLVRYLAGQCSPQEADEVRARLAVDDDLNRRAAELERIMDAARRPNQGPVDSPFDEQDFLARLNHRIDLLDDPSGPSAARPVHAATPHERLEDAAPPTRPIPAAEGPGLPVGSLSHLPAESGNRTRSLKRLARVAIALTLVAAAATILLLTWPAFLRTSASDPNAPTLYTTDAGQRATIRLADGTNVQLNVSSRLAVPSTFPETGRQVELAGEAYFDIVPDASRPFRVRAGRAAIEVLGTEFGVRAYDEERTVQVVVAKGEVSMQATRAPLQDTVVLGPNHLGVLGDASPPAVQRGVVLEPYLAWTEGRLVFSAAPFDEVSRQLERWYDLEVELTVPTDSVGKLSASFGGEPLGAILHVIADALGLHVEQAGRRITFRPASYP